MWPTPEMCRRSLALRHVLPEPGMRVLGRLMKMAMNRSRARVGLPPATNAFCARTVRLRQRGSLTLEGGYLLEDDVELIMGTDGRSPVHGSIVLGHNVALRSGTVISADGGTVRIGESTYVGFRCVLLGGEAGLRIGAHVMFGPHCLVVANNHGRRRDQLFQRQPISSKGISIADNVWVAGHATILDGVAIGTGSVIAAGSVVTRDVPPGVLAAGVPARVVRALGG
jgi:acetyltransferase-like isoleucine patch superfamily enzyme